MKRTSNKNNYCVYVHTNKINGKMYVGQTCNIKERWRCQGKNYFASVKFFNAIKKYGWDNFTHEVIKEGLCREEADSIERELIATFDTINNGYNIKDGGSRGVLSPESLKKMGDAVHKAFTEHPEIKEKIRQKALGRKASEETKRKLSLSRVNTIVININGEIGSIRYWARRIGMDHQPLLRRKKLHGLQYMINYIKEKIKEGIGLVEG